MKQLGTVCFLADKHGLYDDRIYWKMALSLLKAGYKVHYIFIGAEELEGITEEGVRYQSLKQKKYSSNRYLNYIIKYSRTRTNYDRMFDLAADVEADVYHFHDLNINNIFVSLEFPAVTMLHMAVEPRKGCLENVEKSPPKCPFLLHHNSVTLSP